MAKQKRQQTAQQPEKQTNRLHHPHDSFFHRVFSQLDHVREFIRAFLPYSVVSKIKLDALDYQKDVHTNEQLSKYISDLIFEVPLLNGADGASESALIYCLFEHKSTPESDIYEQLLGYMNDRWRLDRENGITQRRLIIPVVFYHGEDTWTLSERFVDAFSHVEPRFHEFVPDFRYILFDTSKFDDNEIATRITSGSLHSSLLLLKYIYDKTLGERIVQILNPIVSARLPRPKLLSYLESILTYMTGTKNRVDEYVLNQALETVFAAEEGMMETILDRWIERGRVIGYKEGREESRQENLEKQRRTILRILNHRNTVDEGDNRAVAARLAKITDEEILDELTDIAFETSGEGVLAFVIHLPREDV